MDTVTLIKLISALVYPFGLVLVLGVVGLLFRWRRSQLLSRLCWFGCITVLVLGSNPKVAGWLALSLERQYPQQALEDIAPHDAIIILGGGLRIPTLPARHVQLGRSADRYWYATRLYRAGKASKILLAGGNVFTQPGLQGEAFYARELLQEWGVPETAIVIESSSRTTAQNLNNTAAILEQEQLNSVLLVTSAIHMPRAYALFRDLPIPVTPASADVLVRQQLSPAVLSWFPSATAMHLSTIALHEYYGHWFNQISREWNDFTAKF